MSAGQVIIMIEFVLFFGAILGFCWWQMRLMRQQIDDAGGSALAKRVARKEPATDVE